MTGGYMTKPTQGSLFKNFRDQLMGVVSARDPGPAKLKKSKTVKFKETKDKSVSKRRHKPSRGRKVKMVLPSHKAKQ
jgi:hypothetical protein